MLHDIDVLILVGARVPVAFFAYPGRPGRLVRDDCEVIELAQSGRTSGERSPGLRMNSGCGPTGRRPSSRPPVEDTMPAGRLTGDAISLAVARMMPENAIICDEAITSGRRFFDLSQDSVPHDYLQITGGSIGIGIPLAAGAAVACPDRKVIGLQADGSGMYTVQGLWTQARENLDVVTVVFANRAYAILQGEMRNVGVNEFGRNAQRMLNIDEPALDWVASRRGWGSRPAAPRLSRNFLSSSRPPFPIKAHSL